ncbi:hypothetical protein NP233_g1563 [Leucocoprinus birnbaumii]|uniref:F-box domain-containing protein n=1 Tax=Leucocoprinus birnbaumii TaxID=56174 RepID=A0AAD5YUQ6_9AGAR|nr:hypothetical protein NP233_g1563 [Leucocoprinus birnbaumii]
MFTELPHDILILVLVSLDPLDLAALGQTCRTLHGLVTEYGWSSYLRAHPRPSASLSRARASWSPHSRVKYDILTDRAWSTNSFVARPLSNPWPFKSSPLLAISANRLVVASGNHLHSYGFGTSDGFSAPNVSFEGSFLLDGHERLGDITGLTLASSSGSDDTFFIALQDGIIERITLSPSLNDDQPLNVARLHASTLPTNDFSESLSSSSNFLLSLSFNGLATLTDHRSLTSTTPLNCPFTNLSPPRPNIFPIQHPLSPSHPPPKLSSSPESHTLSGPPVAPLPGIPNPFSNNNGSQPIIPLPTSSSSAVYGLTPSPPSSPWGSSPQILISGWYDSKVRCYDLRLPSTLVSVPSSSLSLSHSTSSSSNGANSTITLPALAPIQTLHNPWSYEPIYSISSGGGSNSHIAAGSARHSVLSFWDIRNPSTGWSVHAPGNDPSPVYSVILESSRCFGATESRPFVYDFGPGVTTTTYPPITRTRGDKLKPYKTPARKGIDYYVTKYLHSRGNTPTDH